MRDWVNCPICDEPDMRKEDGIINCVNLNCGSNGGNNFCGLPQTVECSRHPETAPDPQNTADGGQGIDTPETVKTSDVSDARDFEPLNALEEELVLRSFYAPETLNDTAKTAMPEPVPPRPLEGDSDPSHNGTQLRGADLMAALAATEYHRSQVQTFTYGAGRETRNVVRDLTKPQGEQEVARFVGEHTATHEQAIQAAEEYRLDLVAAALAK